MIVTIGNTSYDHITIQGESREQIGGAAVYSAIAANIFEDIKVGICSRIGSDYPREYLATLKGLRLDLRGLKQVSGRSTHFKIKYGLPSRAIYEDVIYGCGLWLNPSDIPLYYFKKAKGFHITPNNPNKQLRFIKAIRERTNSIISVNSHEYYVRKYRKQLGEVIENSDIFIINEREALDLTDTKVADNAAKVFYEDYPDTRVVITLGTLGCILISQGEYDIVTSLFNPNVKDPTGAGDCFCGSYLGSYILTKNEFRAAIVGNIVSSLKTENWGFESLKDLRIKRIEDLYKLIISRKSDLSTGQKLLTEYFRL
ncbi:MAG: carbohydrate kinase family protein [Candidatus Hydrothermarchaeota archaeon]